MVEISTRSSQIENSGLEERLLFLFSLLRDLGFSSGSGHGIPEPVVGRSLSLHEGKRPQSLAPVQTDTDATRLSYLY
ncbi:hypothetical protein DNTS_016562 [Danionella cerebrum]|uniref:Uncharacterized protein n=1 Tax=Danionella cerebrum TaxID=2873325 RepID=A0A553NS05_9TELE|nr:hypothetical protein DNTS_016562 [Danionella translucida]